MTATRAEFGASPDGKRLLGYGFKVRVCTNPEVEMDRNLRPVREFECIGTTFGEAAADAFDVTSNHLLTHLSESGPTSPCKPSAGEVYFVYYDEANPSDLAWIPAIQNSAFSFLARLVSF